MSEEPPISADERSELDRFPAPLRALVLAELAAGNAVEEFGHGFPAAPCGAWVRLARPISTRPRATCPEVRFFDRNREQYAGEFTDATGHFFVLEPPRVPEPEPKAPSERMETMQRRAPLASESIVDRFRASMSIDYERWHDGIGYDIALIDHATPSERDVIERELVRRDIDDWRDIEALAALDSPSARTRLRAVLADGPLRLACFVLRYAPHLVSEAERTATLVAALERLDFGDGGLTQAMLLVEEHHPPPIVDALLRGVLTRDGGIAYHFAAMLLVIHGVLASPWDMDERPLLLTLTTPDPIERLEQFRRLCARMGLDPESVLDRIGRSAR